MKLQRLVAPAAVALLLVGGVQLAGAQDRGRGRGGGGGEGRSSGRAVQRSPGPSQSSAPRMSDAPRPSGGGGGYAVPRGGGSSPSVGSRSYGQSGGGRVPYAQAPPQGNYGGSPSYRSAPSARGPASGGYTGRGPSYSPGARPGSSYPSAGARGPVDNRYGGPSYRNNGPNYSNRVPPGASRGYYGGSRAVPRPPGYVGPNYPNRYYSGRYYGSRYYGGYYGPRYYPGRPYWYGAPYRPYYYYSRPWYSFRPWFSIGIGVWAGYAVPFPVYGYQPYYGYGSTGYIGVAPSVSQYGAVSFDLQPQDAELYVDGNYVGRVGDFSPSYPPLTLAPGRHRVEVQAQGYAPLVFDVDVVPGRVIPYRGELQPY